jgi:hypothetical protein
MQWRQIVAGYNGMILDIPPQLGWKLRERYHGWEGENGVIANITACLDLEKEEKQRVIEVLMAVIEY